MPFKGEKLTLSHRLGKKLLPLSLGIFLLISVGFPVVYVWLEVKGLRQTADVYAQDLSENFRKVIVNAPDLWKYQSAKYIEVIQDFLPYKEISSIEILDKNGNSVSLYDRTGKHFIKPIYGSAPIIFNHKSIGTVRVFVATEETYKMALFLFLGCAGLGFSIFMVIFRYPVNVVRGMEGKLQSLIDALKESTDESEELRKHAMESEQRFRGLLQGIDGIVWEADPETLRFSFVSDQAKQILGYPLGQWFDEADFLLNHVAPEESDRVRAHYKAAIAGDGSYELEYPIVSANGYEVWVRDRFRLVHPEGKGKQLRGLMVDVTARRRAERALAAEKDLLRTTLKSIGEGVITIDLGGRIVLMNEMAEKLTGWTQMGATGRSLEQIYLIHDEKTGRPEKYFQKLLLQELFLELPETRLLVSQTGEQYIIEQVAFPIFEVPDKRTGFVILFRDITVRRKLDEEMVKMQKLESIGVLAGGIAHDFNNILISILGNLSIAKRHSTGEEKLLSKLDEARSACLRAQDLTTQLLTFSKGGAPMKKVMGIEELLRESASLALRGSHSNLNFNIDKDLNPIEIDKGQIGQVINNIVLNACQAMPGGGTVSIRAENSILRQSKDMPLRSGKYVKICVMDEGIGISPEYVTKIFDPYFTTKSTGSGLGLATSFSIIKKHDGHITVESKPGKGTAFHIYLPASDKTPSESAKGGKREIFSGKGKVLVMDDEDAVRMVVGSMIEELGYKVEFARNGDEAIELYKASTNSEPFNAALIDLTVRGGMGGIDCIKNLLRIDPAIRAIVSSGYSEDPILQNFAKYGFKDVIKKPYELEDLGEVLHRVINASD